MKRYLLFIGSWYYPSGGWKDFCGDFNTYEDALAFAKTKALDYYKGWFHILDTQNPSEELKEYNIVNGKVI